jgi:RNA recognition motif-containing protein
MAKRLFVGGLPYSVTDQELSDMFAPYGQVVSAKVITDKFTGRSKGFGFVEYTDDESADKAIKGLHDTDIAGRKIAVNEARPLEERAPRTGGFDRGGGRGGDSRGGFSQRGGGKRWN